MGVRQSQRKVVVQDVASEDNGPASFHDGLVCVVRNKKYGFANRKGQLVIPMTVRGTLKGDGQSRQGMREQMVRG